VEPIKVAYVLEDTGLSGGAKVVFEHVRILNRMKIFKAWVVSPKPYPSWLEYSVPHVQVPYEQANFSEADIIVTTFFSQANLFFQWPHKAFLHLCQGYEADYVDDLGIPEIRREIKAFYRLRYPKMTVTKCLKERLEKNICSPVLFVGQVFDIGKYLGIRKCDRAKKKDAILIVGNYRYPFKGIRESLEIAAAIKRVFPFLRVIRIATEDTRAEENGMWDEFWIRVPPKDMFSFLYRARLLIHMAHKEGFGLPVLEAMAAGVPVIARDIPVFREMCGKEYPLFRSEKDAFLFATKILKDKELYEKIRESGLMRAKSFSIVPFIRRLLIAMFFALKFGR